MKSRKPTSLGGARAELKKRLKAVAAERDALVNLRDDVDDLISSCEDAVEGLKTAVEALSRYA